MEIARYHHERMQIVNAFEVPIDAEYFPKADRYYVKRLKFDSIQNLIQYLGRATDKKEWETRFRGQQVPQPVEEAPYDYSTLTVWIGVDAYAPDDFSPSPAEELALLAQTASPVSTAVGGDCGSDTDDYSTTYGDHLGHGITAGGRRTTDGFDVHSVCSSASLRSGAVTLDDDAIDDSITVFPSSSCRGVTNVADEDDVVDSTPDVATLSTIAAPRGSLTPATEAMSTPPSESSSSCRRTARRRSSVAADGVLMRGGQAGASLLRHRLRQSGGFWAAALASLARPRASLPSSLAGLEYPPLPQHQQHPRPRPLSSRLAVKVALEGSVDMIRTFKCSLNHVSPAPVEADTVIVAVGPPLPHQQPSLNHEDALAPTAHVESPFSSTMRHGICISVHPWQNSRSRRQHRQDIAGSGGRGGGGVAGYVVRHATAVDAHHIADRVLPLARWLEARLMTELGVSGSGDDGPSFRLAVHCFMSLTEAVVCIRGHPVPAAATLVAAHASVLSACGVSITWLQNPPPR